MYQAGKSFITDQCLEYNQKIERILSFRDALHADQKMRWKVDSELTRMFEEFEGYFFHQLDIIDARYMLRRGTRPDFMWRLIVTAMMHDYETSERRFYLKIMVDARAQLGKVFERNEKLSQEVEKRGFFDLSLSQGKNVYQGALQRALDLCRQAATAFQLLIEAYEMRLNGRTFMHFDFRRIIFFKSPDSTYEYNNEERQALSDRAEEMVNECICQIYLYEMDRRYEFNLEFLMQQTLSAVNRIDSLVESNNDASDATRDLEHEEEAYITLYSKYIETEIIDRYMGPKPKWYVEPESKAEDFTQYVARSRSYENRDTSNLVGNDASSYNEKYDDDDEKIFA